MKNRAYLGWTLLLATVAAEPLLFGAPALAQTTETTAGPGEIIVTARRREESLLDVPIAVTAITGDALNASGAEDITAISQSVPNVTLENSRGTNSTLTAFIRGVGQQDPVAGFEQGVGIYLDDVYLNRPQGAVLDVYDVDRVEVLRGPQGTLYGRNTVGGAVKYVTRRLNPNDMTLDIRQSVGSYGQVDTVVSGSAPLSSTFRVGGAVVRLTRDGFGTNLTTHKDNYNKDVAAIRLSAEWEPSSTFLVRLAVDSTRDNSLPRQGYRLLPTASLAQPFLLSGHFDTTAGITNYPPISANRVVSSGASLSVNWNLSDQWTLKSITSNRRDDSKAPIDFDSTSARNFDVPAVYNNKQFSEELQLLFEGKWLTFVGGAYYLKANAFDAFDVIFGASGATSFTLGDVDTDTWALFGEATIKLTDELSLTLGDRYTSDERTVHVQKNTYLGLVSPFFGNTAAVNLTPTTLVGGVEVSPNFHGSKKATASTPRVILAWKPDQDLNLYASYSEGFKGGGFDPRGVYTNADVRAGFLPETVDSYEIGAKTSMFGGRATVNADVFFAKYQNVQIPGSVIVVGPPVTFVGSTTNAGAAEMKGVEFEGAASFTKNLSGMLSVGYIDAKYTTFMVGGVNVASQRDIQNTPDWTGSASLVYAAQLFGGTLAFSGTPSYRSATQQFEAAIPLLDQPAYWLYDAAINWTSASGNLKFGLYGRNLSDKLYKTSGYNFPGAATDNSVLTFYGNPRTVTATVEVRF